VVSATQSVFFWWRNENAAVNTIAKAIATLFIVVVVSVLIFFEIGNERGAEKEKVKQCFSFFGGLIKFLLLFLLLL